MSTIAIILHLFLKLCLQTQAERFIYDVMASLLVSKPDVVLLNFALLLLVGQVWWEYTEMGGAGSLTGALWQKKKEEQQQQQQQSSAPLQKS